MAKYGNTAHSFEEFLVDFSKREKPNEDAPLPFRFQTDLLTWDEIKGEVLDWTISILDSANCPDFLKFSIAKKVAHTILSRGVEQYIKLDEEAGRKIEVDATTLYSAALISRAAFLTTYEVCAEWHEHLPDFEIPVLNEYSIHGIKNTRRKMEDKHTVITSLNALLDLKGVAPTQYYGVFDGHGGLDASVYTAKHLHVRLAQQDDFEADVEQALKKSILELDEAYCRKSSRDSLRSGTTAVVAVIRENVLHVAWIGDSQAVLVRGGKVIELMDPHKPEREDEKKRIESLGGCVIWFGAWRVNGTLSVSRAIGDVDYKQFVCGNADTSRTVLDGEEDYLCIACDGFWDVFDGPQLPKLVSDHMKETGDKASLSSALCTKAREAGSNDNITVLVVFLRDGITMLNEEVNGKETAENEIQKDEEPSDKLNECQTSANTNANDVKPEPPNRNGVIVQGSKLQPTVKERPPHKLFVNKPHSVGGKISVLVTESAPHARLPHSVAPRKSHWQKAPIERLDTRGSLLSLSTVESEGVTVPLTLGGADHRLSVNVSRAASGLPAIGNQGREKNHSPVRNSPSPSWMSEPVAPAEEGLTLRYVAKPVAHRPTARKTYRTSIIMNQPTSDDGYDSIGWQQPRLVRRASRSVPEHLDRLSQRSSHQRDWRREQRSRKTMGWNLYGLQLDGHLPLTRNFYRRQKENSLASGVESASIFPDTDIAITNSLYNRLKPKKSKENRFSYLTKESPTLLHRRKKF